MSIRLDRKKMLTVSFFLCCIVPTLFPWFHAGPAQALRGIQLLGPLFIVGAVLYLYAMFAKRCRHVLVLGGLAHGVIFVAYLISFFQFPVVHHGFVGRLDASQPSFWIGCILLAAHLVLFFTTEVAARRRLEKRRSAA